jgi:7-cyano-7-deazaguanine synthase
MQHDSALVLFSGGQDSTTCLAWALDRFAHVETIAFDYGQRHRVELHCRREILTKLRAHRSAWRERLGDDHRLPLDVLGQISETALTREVAISMTDTGLPNTFVPGRNILLLSLAASVAYRRGLKHIVTGVCETDFSGYPDCRDDAVKALQVALNAGMAAKFVIHTPLMWLTKAQTWEMAEHLGGRVLIDTILEDSHSCYLGDRSRRHVWGYGCGECPACDVRAAGYSEFSDISQKAA